MHHEKQDNKAVARRYLELFNKGELDRLDEVVALDLVDHYAAPGQAHGLEGLKQALSGIRSAFPDIYVTIDDLIAEGDTVVVRCIGRGTHRAEFMGVGPTGKEVTLPLIAIYRIASGKITERWNLSDVFGLLQQLRAIAAAA